MSQKPRLLLRKAGECHIFFCGTALNFWFVVHMICPWRTRLCSFSWSFHCSTLHKQSYFISFSKFDVWLLMSWKDCRQPLCKWDPAKKKHPFRVKMVPVFVKRTGSTLELPLAPLSTALEIWSGCLRWWEFFTAAFFFPGGKGVHNIAVWKNGPGLKMYFLLKLGLAAISSSYLCLPEGNVTMLPDSGLTCLDSRLASFLVNVWRRLDLDRQTLWKKNRLCTYKGPYLPPPMNFQKGIQFEDTNPPFRPTEPDWPTFPKNLGTVFLLDSSTSSCTLKMEIEIIIPHPIDLKRYIMDCFFSELHEEIWRMVAFFLPTFCILNA